ncbi:hypothetical protein DYB31_015394 [Aphanomyces astaci]|uniref:Zinc finger PHD-type domain-containing protein n=2 Tax=Aphanomyces astaci TaxID=112090 RepID=A0A397ESE7_APHAT|nr:hypothetical protein DYB31_015394 [Aphanomyces astaci]
MAKRNECPNCQFSLVDAATGACKVCDFIQNKQRTRPCTACGKANCQYFCDTCGNGYHRRCAEKNKVRISPLDDDNEVSVVCPSCEKDDGGAEVTCGGCRKEFTNEDAGLQVGQLVLVEFEMVLYNAVVMEVNEPETSVKIHFVKWSKSFDGWYKMDDERVNESLACDGCNRWFHINCLPEVKSTGRYKAASYVCESCFKEAKMHRTSSKSAKSVVIPVEPTKQPTSRSRSSRKALVVSEDESHDDDDNNGDDEGDDADDDDTIVLSPSSLVQLPELPKRKVGRPSHKQLEAERLALAKRKAMLKSFKEPSSPSTSSSTTKELDTKTDKKKERPSGPVDPPPAASRVAKSPRLRGAAKSIPPPPPPTEMETQVARTSSPKRKAPTGRSSTTARTGASPPKRRPSAPVPSNRNPSKPSKPQHRTAPAATLAKSPSPSPIATDDDSDSGHSSDTSTGNGSSGESDHHQDPPLQQPPAKKIRGSQTTVPPPDTPAAPVASSLPPPSVATATTALIHPRHPHASLMSAKPSANNSKLILLSTLLNSPHYDKHNNQENYPPLLHLQGRNRLDILQDVVSQSITSSAPPPPPPPASPPPPLPPGPAPPAVSLRPAASETGLDFDMHFSLREEMYRLVCDLEEGGHVLRDTATLLRAWTHPTAPRFQDMRFVYLVNKHTSHELLARRLGELTTKPLPSGHASSSTSSHHHHHHPGSTATSAHNQHPLHHTLSMQPKQQSARSFDSYNIV